MSLKNFAAWRSAARLASTSASRISRSSSWVGPVDRQAHAPLEEVVVDVAYDVLEGEQASRRALSAIFTTTV